MKKYCVSTFLFIWFSVSLVKAGPNLIISEVLYNPSGTETSEEWIEIFNPTAFTIDLSNYTLEDNQGESFDFEFQPGNQIVSGGVAIIAKSISGFASANGMSPDFGRFSMSLSNSIDFLYLKNNGTIVDEVAWGSGIWSSLGAGNGESITRVSLGSGPTSWLSNQTPTPGATSLTAVPEPGSVILLGFGLLILGIIGKFNAKQTKAFKATQEAVLNSNSTTV